jgi:hypothetical protein
MGENFLATMAAVIFTDGPRFPGLRLAVIA